MNKLNNNPSSFQADHLNFTTQIVAEIDSSLNLIKAQQWQLWALNCIQHAYTLYDFDFKTAEITLRIVDSTEGQELNQKFRDKAYPTNILTFEYGTDEQQHLQADLVLCWPVLMKEAQEQNKKPLSHAAHLLVHGILHALGFDHLDDNEAEEMETLEINILKEMNISNPYI